MEKKVRNPDFVNKIVEHVIENSELRYLSNKKILDLRVNDVVKCVYMAGLFSVTEVYKTGILICPLDHKGDCEFVNPDFLEKQEVSKDTIKVLYE